VQQQLGRLKKMTQISPKSLDVSQDSAPTNDKGDQKEKDSSTVKEKEP